MQAEQKAKAKAQRQHVKYLARQARIAAAANARQNQDLSDTLRKWTQDWTDIKRRNTEARSSTLKVRMPLTLGTSRTVYGQWLLCAEVAR